MFPSSVAYIFVDLQRDAHSLPVACPRAVATHANRDVRTTGSFISPLVAAHESRPGYTTKVGRRPFSAQKRGRPFRGGWTKLFRPRQSLLFDDVRTPHRSLTQSIQITGRQPLLSNVESFPGEWSPSGRHAIDLLEQERSLARGGIKSPRGQKQGLSGRTNVEHGYPSRRA